MRTTMSPARTRAVAAIAMALPALASAGGAPWYLPDHAKVQLAGNIGVVSPGVGYQLLHRRLEGDLFLGWVPRAIAGADLFATTGKLTWRPIAAPGPRGWELLPLTLALQLTHTMGPRTDFFVRAPDRFGDGYFVLPPALRAGVGFGAAAEGRLFGRVRGGFYVEVVAVDVMLVFWWQNRRVLDPWDVFSLAVGGRVQL